MEFLKEIFIFLNPALTLGAILFIFSSKSYLKAFFAESAKSNVQKRDIEELTQKVEAVKAIYSKENELIKYQLKQLLSLKEHHRDEERNALIKFHGAYIHWIYLLQGINLNDYNTSNLNELQEKKLSLNDFFYNIHVERANLLLIVNNDEIVQKTYELIQKLITYKGFVEEKLFLLQHLLSDNDTVMQEFLKNLDNYEKNKSLLQKLAKDDTQSRKEIEILKKDFQKDRTKEFLICRYACDDFAQLTKHYLVSLE